MTEAEQRLQHMYIPALQRERSIEESETLFWQHCLPIYVLGLLGLFPFQGSLAFASILLQHPTLHRSPLHEWKRKKEGLSILGLKLFRVRILPVPQETLGWAKGSLRRQREGCLLSHLRRRKRSPLLGVCSRGRNLPISLRSQIETVFGLDFPSGGRPLTF